jgi:deoxyribodipyrimidine photo-lyase
MQIVWFKRDLRLVDHTALIAALNAAEAAGDVLLPLYILEPELWQQPDMSLRHYQFLTESLGELAQAFEQIGCPLVIRVGDAVEVLESLRQQGAITGLWSHQETWNGWTYTRDKKVSAWARQHKILWHEPTQHGVVRRLKNRDGWAGKWYRQMSAPMAPYPKIRCPVLDVKGDELPSPQILGLCDDGGTHQQKGGRFEGLRLLHSFLHQRGMNYTREMSSPVHAFDSCSRLSPHLAFGTLSLSEVFQETEARVNVLRGLSAEERGMWVKSLHSFSGRLRWHCHFMQKLEDAPRIEFENVHSAYNDLRENSFRDDYFTAWKLGRTGYPMIDACMRALTTTGWINFRMRAMLMSFASYHLWLHWREPSLHLARLFTDYEPGIHYSQAQMQSGTTGINAIRIYNPIKQGVDQDPTGVFIREWIPALKDMPVEFIHTPWERPDLCPDYPLPIVEEKTARQYAAKMIYDQRKGQRHSIEARAIVEKHGSRKAGLPQPPTKSRRKPLSSQQLDLPL